MTTDTPWRTGNIGAVLFAATDRCVRDKLQILHARGYCMISDAQLALFVQLDPEGTRLTTLAERARLTKQSMVELVDKAAAAGFVERLADPLDRRAKVVRFTPAGERALDALHLGIAAAERQVADAVGPAFLRRMKHELAAYAALPVAGEPVAAPFGSGWRATNIGRLFALSARRFAGEALAISQRHGCREIGEVLLSLFRALDLDGSRLTGLATRARMTKQSMRELVDRAEAMGLVARRPDPHDGRAKVIAFTADGLVLLEQLRLGVAEAEAIVSAMCSEGFVAEMKVRLADYCAQPIPEHRAAA